MKSETVLATMPEAVDTVFTDPSHIVKLWQLTDAREMKNH